MYGTSGISSRRVAVVGQGYVGLPVAIRAVEVGFDVVGYDIDKTRIDCLRRAESFIDDVTDRDVAVAMNTGRYLPTDDPTALAGFDVAVVCVPTHLRDGVPDLSYIKNAAAIVAADIKPGCCIILESTSYPGTTEEIFIPILEAGCGLRAGVQFFAGYSPERIDPANKVWRFHNTPKIIAGVNQASLEALQDFMGGLSHIPLRWPGFGRPSWPNCWRTLSATSISPWSTSSRCTATTWASMSGR